MLKECYIFLGVVKYRFIKSSLCQNVCKLRVKPDHGWKIDTTKVCSVSDLQNIRLHETCPQCSRGGRVKRRNNNAIWQLSLTQYS